MADNHADKYDQYEERIYVDRLWERADADRDGYLQKDEALQFLIELLMDSARHVDDMKLANQQMGKPTAPKADSVTEKIQKALDHVISNGPDFVDKLFKVLDADGDGKITRKEFMAGIPKLLSKTKREKALISSFDDNNDGEEYSVALSSNQINRIDFAPGEDHKSCVVNNVFAPGSLNLLQKLSQVVAINGECVENMTHEEVLRLMQLTSNSEGDSNQQKDVNITFRTRPRSVRDRKEEEFKNFEYEMQRALSMSKKDLKLKSKNLMLDSHMGDEIHYRFDHRPFGFSCVHSTFHSDGTELNAKIQGVTAEMANKGIQVGYHLTEVNGVCTIGMPFDEICQLISSENLPVVICFADLPLDNLVDVNPVLPSPPPLSAVRALSRWEHPDVLSPSSRELFESNNSMNLDELWDRVDKNNDGEINQMELKDLITKYFVFVQQMIQESGEPLDLKNVGEIIDMAIVENMDELTQMTAVSLEILIQTFDSSPDALLDEICKRLDADQNGVIDKSEFMKHAPDLLFRLEEPRFANIPGMPLSPSSKMKLRDHASKKKTFVSLSDIGSFPSMEDTHSQRESRYNRRTAAVQREVDMRHDEYIKEKKQHVFHMITWNMNAQEMSQETCKTLLDVSPKPDVFLIGFQEVVSLNAINIYKNKEKDRGRRKVMDPIKDYLSARGYWSIASKQLVGTLIMCFARQEVEVSECLTQTIGVGWRGYGNKAGVALRFKIEDSTYCCVCSHLAAHKKNEGARDQNYNSIIQEINFILPNGKPVNILEHDCIFWMGDLNYRINQKKQLLDNVLHAIEMGQYDGLLAYDQLRQGIRSTRAFEFFNEAPITFPPTFKFKVGTNQYNTKRIPSWCDRILWRVGTRANADDVECAAYNCIGTITLSDHKPVYGTFKVNAAVIDPIKYKIVKQQAVKKFKQRELKSISSKSNNSAGSLPS